MEPWLGVTLLDRRSGRLVLTESGGRVYRYTDEILSLGRELMDVVTVAELEEVRERFHAVTAKRKIAHPAVKALAAGARTQLFRSMKHGRSLGHIHERRTKGGRCEAIYARHRTDRL